MDISTLACSLKAAAQRVSLGSPDGVMILDDPELMARGVLQVGEHGQRGSEANGCERKGLYQGGLHSNACVEVCFVVEGSCRMWTPDGFVALVPDKLLVIPPNTLHCEGWERQDMSYRVLWLVLIADTCSAFVNAYDPGTGWRLEERSSVQDSASEWIVAALQEPNSAEEGRESPSPYLLQGGLLIVLSDLLKRATAGLTGGEDRQRELVARVKQYMHQHYAEPLTVASMAALFRLSPNYLNALFSRHTGIGIRAYLIRHRLKLAKALLEDKKLLVKEVAYRVGFSDPLYFSRLYKQRFGQPPSAHDLNAN